MRKAIINLDWLEGEIIKFENKGASSKSEEARDYIEHKTLLKVLCKCTPINDTTSKLKTIESLLQGHDKDSNIGVAYQAVKNLIEENNKQK